MQEHAFDPQGFVEVAEHLLARDGEANARSAISRDYYGVFLLARNLAGIKEEGPSTHADTWHHFELRGELEIARGLRQLRRARNRADYRTELVVSRQQCHRAMQTCRLTRAALKVLAGRVKYEATSESSASTPSGFS